MGWWSDGRKRYREKKSKSINILMVFELSLRDGPA